MHLPILPPPLVLAAVICITAVAGMTWRILRRRQRRVLGELARQWGMHYSARDVFGLASHIASRMPIPGAADVRVCDLIYGSDEAGLQYIFCAEYTAGVIRSRSRQRRVLSVLEPRNAGQVDWATLRIAPTDLPLVTQYQVLHESPAVNPLPPG